MRETSILFFLLSLMSVPGFPQRNPADGHGKSNLLPESTVQSIAADQYKLFLSTHTVIDSSGDKDFAMVQRVGDRVVTAAKTYYKPQKAVSAELKSYVWETRLIGKKEVNAWCMPGGKMAVYSGLLAVTQSEASLAVLLAHDIAHLLLKHGNERMKEYLKEKLGGKPLAESLSSRPADTNDMFAAAYGMGTNAGIWVPFSNEQELEADRLGLIFCALAGYNPRESLVFWGRMARLSNSAQEPELLSTHLINDTRITQIEDIMDETVKNYYKPIIKN